MFTYRSSNHKVRDSFQNFFWILYNKHLINLNTQKSQAIRLSFKIYQKLDDFDVCLQYRSSNHKVRDSFQNFFWILYNKHLINLNTQKSQAIRLSFKIYQKPNDFDSMSTYRSSNHKVRDSFQNFFWILYNKHLINLNIQKSQAIRLSFKI